MRLQSTSFTCGPVAICNAISALDDTEFLEETVKELAGSTATYGTSPRQMLSALRKLGYRGLKFEISQHLAWTTLAGALSQGKPVIALVDDGSHWVAMVGMLGSRILIADSADGETVVSRDAYSVMRRWTDEKGNCFGLIVSEG